MKNQINKTLTKSMWEGVVVNDSGEILQDVIETNRLKLGLVMKRYSPSFIVRTKVAEKLEKVATSLPDGINLVLIEGFRTIESQKRLWDDEIEKIRKNNPEWIDEAIDKRAGIVVARPSPLSNHHCGGAVDVTLSYTDGTLLDMGTPYIDQANGVEWQNKFLMLSNDITEEQKINRKTLRDAMETEDFVWYPGEWWHYCWGDRMWAVYSGQTTCFYGPADKFLPK